MRTLVLASAILESSLLLISAGSLPIRQFDSNPWTNTIPGLAAHCMENQLPSPNPATSRAAAST